MRKMNMAQRKHAHANRMDMDSMRSGLSSLKDLILRVDMFKLAPTTGPHFAVVFYSVFLCAVVSIGLAIALTMIPGNTPEDLVKSELLAVHTNWLYARKKQQLSNSSIKLTLTAAAASEQSTNQHSLSKDHLNSLSLLMNLKDSLSEKTSLKQSAKTSEAYNFHPMATIVPSPAEPTSVFTLASSHFEHILPLASITKDSKYYLKIRSAMRPEEQQEMQANAASEQSSQQSLVYKTLANMPTKKGIPMQLAGEMTIDFKQMIKMSLCSNDSECEQECLNHEGSVTSEDDKQAQVGKAMHKLEKHHVTERVAPTACSADFVAKSVCLVASEDDASSSNGEISGFEGSCYEETPAIYAFNTSDNNKKNDESIQIVLRVKGDPFLKALEFSEDFLPYEMQQTQKERHAEYLYLFGAGILFLLILCLVAIRVKEERDLKSQFTQIHHVSTIRAQSAPYISSV